MKRRKFIGTSAATAAATTVVPRHVLGGKGFVAPSDKLNLAYLGCGTQGLREMSRLIENPKVGSIDWLFKDVRQGDCYYFRLLANTVQNVSRSDQKKVPVLSVKNRMEWFRLRGEKNGFHPQTIKIMDQAWLNYEIYMNPSKNAAIFPTPSRDKFKYINFARTLFQGILEVTDPGLFGEALRNGIGPKKNYGFGLLSVLPLK